MTRSRRNSGFSLIELVIVIVIIGLIAAIAVPRLSSGAQGTTDSDLQADLAALRNAIDLYQREHNGVFPAQDNSAASFVDQMTRRTNGQGNVGEDPTIYPFGPYLRGGLPPLAVGPNRGVSGIFIASTGPTVDESQPAIGWIYNSTTGDIIANTDDVDDSGLRYDLY